ncbi:MAG: guanylate kinase [Lachnospiraceae bacterium]|nr:guanylate kinase [Lachnospiraceae bacterium]
MGKIYYLLGKSSSGKDSIYKQIIQDEALSLRRIVSYTTRPIRTGEEEGREYHFTDKEHLDRLAAEDKVIEMRTYHTMRGDWHYFTVDDGQVDLNQYDYAVIGTLESYLMVRNFYGKEHVLPIYIEVDDGIRLMRAVKREMKQNPPHYTEVCRRFLADDEDFSEEHLKNAGITVRFANDELEKTIGAVKAYIQDNR